MKKTLVITPNPDEGYFKNSRNLPEGANLIPNVAAQLFATQLKNNGGDVVYSDYYNNQDEIISKITPENTEAVNLFLGYANYGRGLRLKKALEAKGIKVVINGIYNFVDGQNFSDCSVLKELGMEVEEPISDMALKIDYGVASLGELFEAQEAAGRPRSLAMVSQYAGCPKSKNCLHCSSSKIQCADGSTAKLTKSPEDTIDEIIGLKDDYDVDMVILADLMTTKYRLKKLAEAVGERQMPNLRVSTAPNYITEESIEYLKQLSCEEVFLGVESFNSELIKKLEKPFKLSDIERAMELLFEAGIKANASLMLGIEGENKTTLENTLNFVNHWRKKKIGKEPFLKLQTSLVTPIPGSRLYKLLKEKIGAEETANLLKEKDWIGALQKRYTELFLDQDIAEEVAIFYTKLRSISESSYGESNQEVALEVNRGLKKG